jgi:FtsH-binding integral membrane protein
MGIALFISGLAAFLVGNSPLLLGLITMNPIVALAVMLSPMVFALASNLGVISPSISVTGMKIYLFTYATILGISLSTIFLLYTRQSLAITFLTTSLTFGAMSLYGYRTNKDLSGLLPFLYMTLMGLLITVIFNVFFRSPPLSYLTSFVGVIIFVLFTAYDIQNIKSLYNNRHAIGIDNETLNKLAVRGTLELYLDFVNLFLHLLKFLGKRRED